MSDPMRPQKKIDESWKDEVEKEKTSEGPAEAAGGGSTGSPQGMPPVDFMLFLSTLALQAYVALGDAPDPSTNEKSVHLEQAKYMIDIIGVIEEKTRGNLNPEESQVVAQLLYELRLRFVEKSEEGK